MSQGRAHRLANLVGEDNQSWRKIYKQKYIYDEAKVVHSATEPNRAPK